MASRSIAANCRKVVCIGRNYAYASSSRLLLLPLTMLQLIYLPKRPHKRAQQCPSEKAFLFYQTFFVHTSAKVWSRTPAQRREFAL